MKKYNLFTLITIIVTLPIVLFSDTVWENFYGSTGNDTGYKVLECTDGGFIALGDYNYNYSSQNSDIYIIKTTQDGVIEWEKIYGGTQGDFALDGIYLDDFDETIIAGYTHSYGEDIRNAYLLKINSSGDSLWQKTYGMRNYNVFHNVIRTSDNNLIMSGECSVNGPNNDCYIVKTDLEGEIIWEYTFGGDLSDSAYNAIEHPENGYIIIGTTRSSGAGMSDILIFKLDNNGQLQWEKTYGGTANEWGFSGIKTTENNIIINGMTSSFGNGNDDVYLLKLNSDGDSLWTKTYGGSGKDWCFGISLDSLGNIILTGETNSFGNGLEGYYIKIDSSGNFIEDKVFGTEGEDGFRNVLITDNGSYLFIGGANSTSTEQNDLWLLKYSPVTNSIDQKFIKKKGIITSNYPNPFNPSTNIEYILEFQSDVIIKISDNLGKLVKTVNLSNQNPGKHSYQLDGKKYTSGTYYYKIITDNDFKVNKMQLIK